VAVPFRIVVPQSADLELSLGNGLAHVLPGDVVAWELRVANAGPSAATGTRLQFAVPTGVSGAAWSCTPIALASCPAAGAGGGIDLSIDLPVGGVLRFVLAGTVQAPVGAMLNATATASLRTGLVDPHGGANTGVDNDPVVPEVVLSDDFEGEAKSSVPGGEGLLRD
jgi:uncharacterized repeat protein (TIGR01451 family)